MNKDRARELIRENFAERIKVVKYKRQKYFLLEGPGPINDFHYKEAKDKRYNFL